MTNLQLLQEIERSLPHEELHSFSAYLLGALSTVVGQKKWREVVLQSAARFRQSAPVLVKGGNQ